MRRSPLKNLFLSSVLFLLLSGCAPTIGYKFQKVIKSDETNTRLLTAGNKALLFKARIKVYNKRYSGLILIKQLPDGISHLTFVTEIGMKMFDFEVKDQQLKLVYIFEPLNKPRIIQLLQSDMSLLLLQDILQRDVKSYSKNERHLYTLKNKGYQYYTLNSSTHAVLKSKVKGKLFTQRTVNYIYNDSLQPQEIRLKHKGLVRVKINLQKLNH